MCHLDRVAEEQPTVPPQTDVRSGVRWSAAGTWGAQAAQFVTTIILARLLLPEDYGLMAMAGVVLGFLNLFRTMGFTALVIQRPRLTESLLSTLFFLNFSVAIGLALLAVAAAPLCAWIYQDPRIAAVVAVMGATFIFSASAVVPLGLLLRQMRFDRVAMANLAAIPVSAAAAIALAAAGYGVWSLVAGSIAGVLANTTLIHALCAWHPKLIFQSSDAREGLNFGIRVTGFNFFRYFARYADSAIIGAVFGAGPLGFYSMAKGIVSRLEEGVTSVISGVLFPTLARVQEDDARLKALYLRACGAIAFVTFPMMAGLAAMPPAFLEALVGTKWLRAAPVLTPLAILGAFRAVGSTTDRLLLAKGRTGCYFWWGVFSSVIYVSSIVGGLPWGLTGVAVSYLFLGSLANIAGLWLAAKGVKGLTLTDLARELRPYFVHSVAMAFSVFVASRTVEMMYFPRALELAFLALLGLGIYGALATLTRPAALQDFLSLFPRMPVRSARERWMFRHLRPRP